MINIKCTEKQALIIEQALDSMSRMCSGQLSEIERGISNMRGKPLEYNQESEGHIEIFMGYKLGSYIQDLIKPILFPELQQNESYGVGMKEIGNAQIAYEISKKLQNFRSRNMKTPRVLAHEPLHYSKEPLIEITDSEKEKN